MTFQFNRLDHVQLAIPNGAEDKAREFYRDILGFSEVEKPHPLKKRGGVWFASGKINIHLGVAEPFIPQKKAHPAFQVENLSELMAHLKVQQVAYQQDYLLPGADRIYMFDPFGNRLEFLEWHSK